MSAHHRGTALGQRPSDRLGAPSDQLTSVAFFPLQTETPHAPAPSAPRAAGRHRSGEARHRARGRGRLVTAGILAVGVAVGSAAVASGIGEADTVAADSFFRTVAAGWGSAAAGGDWSATAPVTGLSVRPEGATVVLPAERSGRSVWLSGVSATDVSARADVTFRTAPAGNGQLAAITLRKIGRQQEYRVRARLASDRSLRVSFSKIVLSRPEQRLGAETVVASGVRLGVPVTLAAAVSGQSRPTLSAAAWPATAAQPSGWQARYTDGTDPVSSAGTLGMWFYTGAGQVGSTPLQVTSLLAVDRVDAGPISGAPRPVPTLQTLSPAPSPPTTTAAPSTSAAPPATSAAPTTAPVPASPGSGARAIATAGASPLGSTRYPVPADAIVVSPGGNDGAAGTASAPFRTIGRAVQAASSGQTIVLRGGTYHERVQIDSIKARLTIQNWPGEAVWLDGSSVVASWVQDGSAWRHDGWSVQFDSSTPSSSDPAFQMVDPAYPMAAHPDQVWISGKPLVQVGSRAAVTAGTFYVDQAADRLYVGSSPAGQEVRASDLAEAIYLNHSDGTTVRGIGVRRYATPVQRHGTIKAFGNNETLADLHVESNAVVGVGVDSSNVKILNNTIQSNGQLGLNAHHSDGLVLRGNLVRNNNTEHFKQIPVAGGVKVTSSRDITVSGNAVVNNGSTGIWLDESVWNATIVRNDVLGNTHHGIYFEISAKALIADNVVVDNADSGIRVVDSAHARIWNNTVLRNSIGIDIMDGPRVATDLSTPGHDSRRPLPDPDMTWIVSDVHLRSNVLDVGSRTRTPYLFRADDGTDQRTAEQMQVTADYDLFVRPSAAALANEVAWSNGANGIRYFTSVAAFRSGTGQEAHGFGQDAATTAVLNGDTAAGDLGLRADNPANGKGAPLPADIAAAIGQPAGGAPDPGAFFG